MIYSKVHGYRIPVPTSVIQAKASDEEAYKRVLQNLKSNNQLNSNHNEVLASISQSFTRFS